MGLCRENGKGERMVNVEEIYEKARNIGKLDAIDGERLSPYGSKRLEDDIVIDGLDRMERQNVYMAYRKGYIDETGK